MNPRSLACEVSALTITLNCLMRGNDVKILVLNNAYPILSHVAIGIEFCQLEKKLYYVGGSRDEATGVLYVRKSVDL